MPEATKSNTSAQAIMSLVDLAISISSFPVFIWIRYYSIS
jgi:hypothetical protein